MPGQIAGRAPVYSYHSVRDARLNERARSNTVKQLTVAAPLWHRVLSAIGWLVFASALSFELWLSPLPKVTVVSLPGTIARSESAYQDGLKDIWSKSIFNHSKVTIQTEQLSQTIKQRFPELASADIELPLLGQLPNVVLTPAEPVILLVTQNGVFYLGADGKTLARTDQVTANALGGLPTVRDDSGLVPEPGKNGLPKQTITTVIKLLRLSASANIDVESLSLPISPNEIDLLAKGTTYTVRFALDQDPRQGIGALLALRDKFKSDNISPSSYLDLRVPDKAFYK